MGLDIYIKTDRNDIIISEIQSDSSNTLNPTLSRNFLRLILRQHEPDDQEILQLSELTGIDLEPLLEMGMYPHQDDEDYQLSRCRNEQEREDAKLILQFRKEHAAKPVASVIDILQRLDRHTGND